MRKRVAKKENDFVPLDESDLKHATEVAVKQVDEKNLMKVEKQGKKKKSSIKKDKEPGIKINGKYSLIVCEKPQASLKIATALGKPKKFSQNKVPYYEIKRDSKKIIVAAAVGHLFTLKQKEKGEWPIFNIEWVPNYKVRKEDWSKKYYSLLTKLCKNASEYIVACDYDVEGEVIGWNIIRFICGKKDAKRMKFSTLTKDELEKAYNNLLPTIDWGQAIAGETRHYLDWMYGINLSRALMSAIKKAGKFRIMSIGRVQGPTLKLIVNKELEIQKFKSTPYWQIFIKLKKYKTELKYEKDIKNKKDLDVFKNLKGKTGEAVTNKKKRKLIPPFPFDLTSLQREAYRLFRLSPTRTLQIAQQLYLAGVISYPRTSSQKIPDSIQPKKILKKLSGKFKEVKFAVRARPIEGRKSDPAHPSIYPTGEMQNIAGENKKIYDLIVKRFISCFCEDAEIESKKIIFETENKKKKLKFLASGLGILDKGWMNVYPATIKETEIKDLNGKQTIEKSRIEEKQTQPPKRYTPASIITELEKRNLGTKATRAQIIETLYSRNYIKEQSIQATPFGISLISTLEKHSPVIIDEKLTREFEKDMVEIQRAKKNLEVKEKTILDKAEKSIIKISKDFSKNELKIGKELVKANDKMIKQEREENILTACPVCKKGKLRILYNRNSKRYFIGCSNYPKCKTTFTLPYGLIKRTDKECEFCKFPKLLRIQKAKRPWLFCFNPDCKSNKEWRDKVKKKSQ